jgi:phosphatidate cytidylyltransferase
MKNLKTRAISAAIFAVVMLFGLLYNALSFKILFTIIAIGAIHELINICIGKEEKNSGTRKIFYTLLACIPLLLVWSESFDLSKCIYLLMLCISVVFIAELYMQSVYPFQNVGVITLSVFYVALPIVGLILLSNKDGNFSNHLAVGLLFLTWSNDTGAYFAGSKFGKNKFFPRISPNKTWEGTIGGGLLCIITAIIFSRLFTEYCIIDWIVFGLIVSVFGSLGDLVESMLKRSFDIKDSGNIMPGHGGFLDRFDAFIFILPFVCFYFKFFH